MSGLDLPQGTLDLLILKAVALEPRHGCAIAERIAQISRGAVAVRPGSLYPALHRLERRGLLRPRWGASENNRRAKFYELTVRGRKQLEQESAAWRQLTVAVNDILESA
ncbi:MAG: PadR family transcriptional regulator [Acidobacteria bacterium]|nr:MAG: PadR family transcriptional regulator [Acidobacteriota bacterium]